ncbi:MAG: pentapeptide repeat-containing protein [Halobacteriaceae archaeon]
MTRCAYVFDPADAEHSTLEGTWACPHETVDGADRCPFHLDEAARRDHGVTDEVVCERLVACLRAGDRDQMAVVGADLGAVDLDHRVFEGETRYPIDLRHATIDRLSLRQTRVRHPLRLDGATVGSLRLDGARLVDGLRARNATVDSLDAFETEIRGDARFDGVCVPGDADFDEAAFDDDVSFEGATFGGAARFRGAEFHGRSNLLEDHTSFAAVTFEGPARFDQARFRFTDFAGAAFTGRAGFEKVRFDGDVAFREASFGAAADFDEARFDGDADFDGVRFDGAATFRGAEFAGGSNLLADDCTFEGVRFSDEANFRGVQFRFADFAGAEFRGHAMFEESRYGRDVSFAEAHFRTETDFDEARFDGDADFSDAVFSASAVFRGAEFTGEANHLEDNVTFEGARFAEAADFDRAAFTTANFRGVSLGGVADFRECAFTERLDFKVTSLDRDTYVDMTGASLADGTIEQPADEWMRYDLTGATLGDVQFAGHGDDRELLDCVRFCETDFAGFDFADHLESLERNNWLLHEFDENDADYDYRTEMTPAAAEVTYLNAKNAASAHGNQKAAGEFRVRRQQFARQKDLALARDDALSLRDRLVKLTHAAENVFLGVTCGYGHRLARVIALFVLAPLPFGLLFTVGGPAFRTEAGQVASVGALFTARGLRVLFRNTYFAYTSYTTVGYGDFSPLGALARMLAVGEAFVVVIFSGLVLYTLIKRSEQ